MQLIYVTENYLKNLAIDKYAWKSTHATYIATNLAKSAPLSPTVQRALVLWMSLSIYAWIWTIVKK